MTALATRTTTTADGLANGPEASEVFHVEHRCARTGHRVELARYVVGDGEERIVFGQRVDGVVRFLPGKSVVLVAPLGRIEDSTCRSRTMPRAGGCAHADRRQRPNGASERCGVVAGQREDRS
jgi:hypothetical protein